ncbi:MAG: type II secretion system F family protein [Lachnospiraceae bacterium]|nr:type II secretion system F family protein [Lachnospiraceae bacterium]
MKIHLPEKILDKLIRSDVRNMLILLHPGQDVQKLCREYYAKKLVQSVLILTAGFLLVGIMALVHRKDSVLQDGNRLIRGDYQSESETVDLVITGEDETARRLTYELLGRTYSEKRLKEMAGEIEGRLPGMILGENESAENVTAPLLLTNSFEGYPFEVEWESSNYALLDDDGSVNNTDLKESEAVTVVCSLHYREFTSQITFPVIIAPKPVTDAESSQDRILRELRQEDLSQQESEEFLLPGKLFGEKVRYETADRGREFLLFPVVIVITVLLYCLRDRDLSEELQKRKTELELSYPDFVEKYVLYTGAGVSSRGCLERISADANISPYLQSELQVLLRDLGNGILESQALDSFGRRCKSPLYIKFAGMLIQNRKKGGPELMRLLSEECAQAFVLRKNQAKKLGEEASTKLLIPMIMMLGVVMVVIIMPAFLSF